jgi:glyoxylase-like metal-dependent hydrolase (beta-lactamase superfamily II)
MKHFFLPCAMVALTTLSVLAQDVRLIALDESSGRTMNVGVFASADQDTVKKYMPNGSAPASMSSFVLFAGEDMVVLFDTGQNAENWSKKLTDLGVKPENVKLIFITHFHGDHIGGFLNGDAKRFPNANVMCSEPEYEAGQQQPAIVKIKAAYGEVFQTFEFDSVFFVSPLVKVKAIDASGHTPGHTAFLIEPAKEDVKLEKTLIVGDLLHAAALQFPAPEACASFDMDKEKSVATRKRVLDLAAAEKWLIGGMHFPPPSVGTVKKEGSGYTFELKAETK